MRERAGVNQCLCIRSKPPPAPCAPQLPTQRPGCLHDDLCGPLHGPSLVCCAPPSVGQAESVWRCLRDSVAGMPAQGRRVNREALREERRDGQQRRPDDWTCSNCHAMVFASRRACFKCGAVDSRTAGGTVNDGGAANGGEGEAGHVAPLRGRKLVSTPALAQGDGAAQAVAFRVTCVKARVTRRAQLFTSGDAAGRVGRVLLQGALGGRRGWHVNLQRFHAEVVVQVIPDPDPSAGSASTRVRSAAARPLACCSPAHMSVRPRPPVPTCVQPHRTHSAMTHRAHDTHHPCWRRAFRCALSEPTSAST